MFPLTGEQFKLNIGGRTSGSTKMNHHILHKLKKKIHKNGQKKKYNQTDMFFGNVLAGLNCSITSFHRSKHKQLT